MSQPHWNTAYHETHHMFKFLTTGRAFCAEAGCSDEFTCVGGVVIFIAIFGAVIWTLLAMFRKA
jgi:hypothetical protein